MLNQDALSDEEINELDQFLLDADASATHVPGCAVWSAAAGWDSGTLTQAIRSLGRRNVDDHVVGVLRRRFSDADKQQRLTDQALASIAGAIRKVAQAAEPGG